MYKTGGFINTELIEPQLVDSYEQLKIYVKLILTILPNTPQLKINEITKIQESLKEIQENINSNINKKITDILYKNITELVVKLEKIIKYTDTDKSFNDKSFNNPSIPFKKIIYQEYVKIKLMININCFYKNEKKCANLTEFDYLIKTYVNSTFGIEKKIKSSSYIIIQKFGELYVEIESQNIKNPNVEILVLEDNLSLSKNDSILLDNIKFNNINNNNKYVVYNFTKNSENMKQFITAKQIGNKFINVVNNIMQINKDTDIKVYIIMNDFIKELRVLLSILYRYNKETLSYIDTIQYVDNFFIYFMFINKLKYIFNIIVSEGVEREQEKRRMDKNIEKSKEEIIYSYNYYLYCILRKNNNTDNSTDTKTFVDEINKFLNYTKEEVFILFKKNLNEFIDILLAVERKFKGLTILILFNFILHYFTIGQDKGYFKISKYKLLTTLLGGTPSYYSYEELIIINNKNSNVNAIINIYMNNIKLNYNSYSILGKQSVITYNKIIYSDCGEITFFNLFNYLLLTYDNKFDLTKLPPDSDIYNFYKKYNTFKELSEQFRKDGEYYNEKSIKEEFYRNITDHTDISYAKGGICEIKPSVNTIIKLFNIILNKKFEKFDNIVQYFNKKITSVNETYGNYKIDDIIEVGLLEDHASIVYNNIGTDRVNIHIPTPIMLEYNIVSLQKLYNLNNLNNNINILLLYDDDFYNIMQMEDALFNSFYLDDDIYQYMTKKNINLYFINMFTLIYDYDAFIDYAILNEYTILNDKIKLLIDIVIKNDIIITEDLLRLAIIKVKNSYILKTLIDRCTINENYNLVNSSLLIDAIKNNTSIEIIKLLIKKNNTVNIVEPDTKATALMYAVISTQEQVYDKIQLIKLLLDNKADINLVDNNKMSVLMYAIKYNVPKEILQLLIDNKVDINLVSEFNTNALMMAFKYNAPKEIIELLIEKVDNINLVDVRKESALMYALINKGSAYVPVYIIQKIIDKGANINLVDNKGKSVLMQAVINKDPFLTKLIIEKGANINLVDNKGKSALMHAVINNAQFYIIELLIKKGANVTLIDNTNMDALQYAEQYNLTRDIINLLHDNSNMKNNTLELFELKYFKYKNKYIKLKNTIN